MLIKAILLIGFCYVTFLIIELYFSRKASFRQAEQNKDSF